MEKRGGEDGENSPIGERGGGAGKGEGRVKAGFPRVQRKEKNGERKVPREGGTRYGEGHEGQDGETEGG